MLTGKTLKELATTLQEQCAQKQDYLVHSNVISLDNLLTLHLGKPESEKCLGLTETGHRQLAYQLGIPKRFYDRLQTDYKDVLAHTVTELAKKDDKRYLVRVLHNNARAFLSDKYRTIDNYDLLEAILPTLLNNESTTPLQVISSEVTERKMYIKIIFPTITGEIKVGDPVNAGFVISNSEIGEGAVRVERLLYILRCTNGLKLPYNLQQYHAGKRSAFQEFDDAVEMYSTETQKLDNAAFFSKVRDIMIAAFDREDFNRQIEAFRNSTQDKINKDPIEFIDVTAKHFALSAKEKTNAIKHFLQYEDFSRYGLMNAITSTAQEPDTNYDRSTELEELGGSILTLPKTQWEILAN